MMEIIKVIDGATATTTSQAIRISDAKKVVLFCKRSAHDEGNTAFSATVSHNGTDYRAYSKWISNTANANTEFLTRVASVTISSNACDFLTMDPSDFANYIKVTATETTDGTHDAWLIVQY